MNYEDILYCPHHVSPRRAAMPMIDRAAQFAPFAALTGHEGMIRETARLTEPLVELTEDAQGELDRTLRLLEPGMQVRVIHFVPDARKDGGAYMERRGVLRRVDGDGQGLIFADGSSVLFRFLVRLEIAG